MTNNSYICNFINENPYDWKERLEKYPYFLKIKEDNGLYIFNYNMLAFEVLEPATDDKPAVVAYTNFNLPITQEARGIIINPETKEVVCWPFRKFGNFGESYVDSIDWKSAKVQEKVDGSIMKVWFDKRNKKWAVSTNSMIDAYKAQNGIYVNFGEIFDEAAFGILDYSRLDTDNTYIFELVSPKTRVVIDYEETKIYHIGTRSNITGKEFDIDIGVEKPKEYNLSSLTQCIEAAKLLNETTKENKYEVKQEGFVVRDKDFNRIKIKSPDYLLVHNTLNNGVLSLDRTFELVENNETEEYLTYFPQHRDKLDEFKNRYYTVLNNIEEYCKYTKNLYKKLNFNKKALAEIIKSDKYSTFGFTYINNEKSANELFNALTTKNKNSFIEKAFDYSEINPSVNKIDNSIQK